MSSTICSVFQPMVIPENPHLKQLVKASMMKEDLVHKIMVRISIFQLPVIMCGVFVTYFVTTNVEQFKQQYDLNLIFTADQLFFFTFCIVLPLLVLAFISTLVFAYNWENRGLKNVGYLSANLVLLVSTVAVVVVLPCLLMPPTPHSLVTVRKEENRIFIGEAISFDEMSGDGRLTCRYGECKNNGQTKPRNLKLLEMIDDDGVEQKNSIFTFANLSKYPEVSLYHPESPLLEKVIQEAECGVCSNNTYLCSKLTRHINA